MPKLFCAGAFFVLRSRRWQWCIEDGKGERCVRATPSAQACLLLQYPPQNKFNVHNQVAKGRPREKSQLQVMRVVRRGCAPMQLRRPSARMLAALALTLCLPGPAQGAGCRPLALSEWIGDVRADFGCPGAQGRSAGDCVWGGARLAL